ncbi:hypothetical protein FKM82_019159 [Ascaphus truei]
MGVINFPKPNNSHLSGSRKEYKKNTLYILTVIVCASAIRCWVFQFDRGRSGLEAQFPYSQLMLSTKDIYHESISQLAC